MQLWTIGLDRNALWQRMHWSGIRSLIFTSLALFGLFSFIGSHAPLGLIVTAVCAAVVVASVALMIRSLLLWLFSHRHVIVAHRDGITIRSLWQTRTIPWRQLRRVDHVNILGGMIIFEMTGAESNTLLRRYASALFDPYALPAPELARHLNQQRRRFTTWK